MVVFGKHLGGALRVGRFPHPTKAAAGGETLPAGRGANPGGGVAMSVRMGDEQGTGWGQDAFLWLGEVLFQGVPPENAAAPV